jgi:hypothetical protein
MNNSTSNNKICTFTKIKAWYMPVDAETYKLMKAADAPLTRVHENMMPTLLMLLKSRKLRAKAIDFNEALLNPYLDELGRRWQKKPHRKATITSSVLKFETEHASAAELAREAIPKLETSLRRFFQRWGFVAEFQTSEHRGKIKFHVSYKFDSNKMPIIPLVEEPESLPQIRLNLGYVRLTLTLGSKEVETNIALAAGTDWNSIHTSRCLYSQISDVRAMIGALAGIVSKDEHNGDNKL